MLVSKAGSYGLDRGRRARGGAAHRGLGLGMAGIMAAGIIAFGGLASEASAQFELENYSLRLGLTSSRFQARSTFGNEITIRTSDGKLNQYMNWSTGFNLGAAAYFKIADIELPSGNRRYERLIPYVLGLEPSAMLVSKGGKGNATLNVRNASDIIIARYPGVWTTDAYYLDIHVPLTFKREFKGFATKVGIGPYIGIGLFGDQTYDVPGYTGWTYSPPPWKAGTFGDDGISRFDGGLVYDVSFEFADLFLVSFRGTSGLTEYGYGSWYATLGYIIKAAGGGGGGGSRPNFQPATDY